MIGRDFARFSNGLSRRRMQYNDFSSRGVCHEISPSGATAIQRGWVKPRANTETLNPGGTSGQSLRAVDYQRPIFSTK